MQIILLTKGQKKTLSFSLRLGRSLVAVVCVFTSLIASYFFYANEQVNITSNPSSYAMSELKAQRTELARLGEKTRNTLDSMALHVGQMQAQLTRLNAVGEHLAKKAKLNSSEFDFGQPVAVGGAELTSMNESFTETQLLEEIDALDLAFSKRENQLELLGYFSANKRLSKEIRPAGLPVEKGWLSSQYGYRADPFSGKKVFHHGVDIAGKSGTKILAAASGLVTWTGEKNGYGYLIEIDHGSGYVTRYGHNKKILVKVGDVVKQSDVIANMGSTGRSTGPHVHFEVLLNGKKVNPRQYLYSTR